MTRHITHALRGLRAEKTFAAIALLTLAVGVATVTAGFSIADNESWKQSACDSFAHATDRVI